MNNARAILLYTIFLFSASYLVGQTNRALVVAIANYPPESGWKKTHALNDVILLKQMLAANNYQPEHCTYLLNEHATRKAVISQLKKMTQVAGKGDYIYVHFSCHGQLMFDDNGDEADGYDESMVLYHAQRKYIQGVYEGEEHLRDDELGEWLDKIRKKIGPEGSVMVVLDACHSATGTRKDKKRYRRGTTYKFEPKGYIPPRADPTRVKNALKKDSLLSPLHVFSACKDTEVNYEYYHLAERKNYGILTYAFCSLTKEKYEIMNYYSWAKKLFAVIKQLQRAGDTEQTPVLETTNGTNAFKISR